MLVKNRTLIFCAAALIWARCASAANTQDSPVTASGSPLSLSGPRLPNEPTVSPVQEEATRYPWEVGAVLNGGFGTNDETDVHFLNAGVRVGKVLFHGGGQGLLKGQFEYAVEVLPYWQVFSPKVTYCDQPTCDPPLPTRGGTFTGASIEPILLRWNFTHGHTWMPWLQGGGGVVWTDHKFPAGPTSVWNFTPQFGIGTHIFTRAHRSITLEANAVHLSSASLGDHNPGINASVQLGVGYTWWK